MEELRKAGWAGAAEGNVILFPGGGYDHLSVREGQPVADAFAAQGFRPWILSYALAGPGEVLGTVPLRQAAAAVAAVREEFPREPVYVCGFSAGAHVAASLGVHWKDAVLFEKERQESIRPDGMILCYPVISSGAYAHERSFARLAGNDAALRKYFSLENFVDADTPRTFLWHTASDGTVPVQNSLLFAGALARERVPFELHIYPFGRHGLSLATREVENQAKELFPDEHVAEWFADCIRWLRL